MGSYLTPLTTDKTCRFAGKIVLSINQDKDRASLCLHILNIFGLPMGLSFALEDLSREGFDATRELGEVGFAFGDYRANRLQALKLPGREVDPEKIIDIEDYRQPTEPQPTELRPNQLEIDPENLENLKLPKEITFDQGRCSSFVDRIMNHYESGLNQPKLMLVNKRKVVDIIAITPEHSHSRSLSLKIQCADPEIGNNGLIRIDLNDSNRLVQFESQNGETCLGWEDPTNKMRSGFIYFKTNTPSIT